MTSTGDSSASVGLLQQLGSGAFWRRAWRCAWPALSVAAGTTLAAYAVRRQLGAVLAWDEQVIRAATDITRAHPEFRTALLVWEHVFLERYVYGTAALICLWVGRRRGLPGRAWWAMLTMLLVWNLNLDLKYLVQRLRPVVEDAVSHAPGYSFPSGHVANVAAASTAVALLVWPLLRSRGARAAVVALGLTLTALTALDRIYLGVHYPTDTAAGALVGPGMVLASYLGYRSLDTKDAS